MSFGDSVTVTAADAVWQLSPLPIKFLWWLTCYVACNTCTLGMSSYAWILVFFQHEFYVSFLIVGFINEKYILKFIFFMPSRLYFGQETTMQDYVLECLIKIKWILKTLLGKLGSKNKNHNFLNWLFEKRGQMVSELFMVKLWKKKLKLLRADFRTKTNLMPLRWPLFKLMSEQNIKCSLNCM